MKVLVDTNGLMVQAQFGVDVLEELGRLGYDECLVPSAVLDELSLLAGRARGEGRVAVAVAQELARRCACVPSQGSADDVIADLAKRLGADVFTNDAALRRRLRGQGTRTVYLRSRHKLEADYE